MPTFTPLRADIVALDAEENPVLVGEIKASDTLPDTALEQLQAIWSEMPAPFALLADLQRLRLLRWDGAEFETIFEAPTAQILSAYDADFAHKPIFDHYFGSLIEAWLNDLSYRWKHPEPPGWQELTEIGFVSNLADTTFIAEPELRPKGWYVSES